MRRRTVLRRITTGGLLAAGMASVSAAERTVIIDWTFDDGHSEQIEASAFDRRSDTPSLATLELSEDCCDCPEPTRCLCIDPPC